MKKAFRYTQLVTHNSKNPLIRASEESRVLDIFGRILALNFLIPGKEFSARVIKEDTDADETLFILSVLVEEAGMSEPTYHIWKYYNDNDSKMIRAINESDALKILWRAIGDDFFKPDTTFTVKIEKTTISADDCPFGVGQIRLDAYITPVNVK